MAWDKPGGGSGPDSQWGKGLDLDRMGEKFQQYFGRFGGGSSVILVLCGLLLLWGLFGIYQLDQQERAVILRFGKFAGVAGPGLRWNPPLIDRIHRVNVTKVYSISYSGQMLTQDENIVSIQITAQYRILDPVSFVLRVREPLLSLHHAMESALRHVVGGTGIDKVITFGREEVAEEVNERLQRYTNLYETGINIVKVNINEADPPQEVKAAFDDVNKALEDEARFKNEAEAYANEVVPRARGKARRVEEEAEAYRQDVIARATGEAERFDKLRQAYEQAPEVTRERLYIDAVEEVLSGVSKVVVDMDEGGSLFFLPLDRMLSGQLPAAADNGGSSGADSGRALLRQLREQAGREASRIRRGR